MNEHLKQTGRTTRMVELANAWHRGGGRSVIVVHDSRYAKLLRASFPGLNKAVRIDTIDTYPIFNWARMRPETDNDYTCRYFVDHAAVEQELEALDKQILRLQQLARQLYALTT